MPTKSRQHSKITILQPRELKRTIEQAAAKRGMSVTSFVNSVLAREAERTLGRVRRRELSDRGQQALLELLHNPKGPNVAATRQGGLLTSQTIARVHVGSQEDEAAVLRCLMKEAPDAPIVSIDDTTLGLTSTRQIEALTRIGKAVDRIHATPVR